MNESKTIERFMEVPFTVSIVDQVIDDGACLVDGLPISRRREIVIGAAAKIHRAI